MTAVLTPGRTNNAIYECCAANDRWPTLMELSRQLEAPAVEVHASLTQLVARRMVRERELDGRRVWLPWSIDPAEIAAEQRAKLTKAAKEEGR